MYDALALTDRNFPQCILYTRSSEIAPLARAWHKQHRILSPHIRLLPQQYLDTTRRRCARQSPWHDLHQYIGDWRGVPRCAHRIHYCVSRSESISGQLCLLVGNLYGSVRIMALGMFIFGLGVSPLAVVQETIIVRFFKSHGLGVSLALGLVAGKGASFISARTSYPLAQHFGPHAPFYAAAGLAGFSFVINLVYLSASKWLVKGAGAELEANEIEAEAQSQVAEHIRTGSIQSLSEAEALKEVAKKRTVNLRDITKLGDVFWAYIGLNILCGAIWAPFTHLCA
jgi:hypothetical protein